MAKKNKIVSDIIKHFKELKFEVIDIERISEQPKEEIPFNINEWNPKFSTGAGIYINCFWKVIIKDSTSLEFVKWVNTGHLFGIKLYLVVKD